MQLYLAKKVVIVAGTSPPLVALLVLQPQSIYAVLEYQDETPSFFS